MQPYQQQFRTATVFLAAVAIRGKVLFARVGWGMFGTQLVQCTVDAQPLLQDALACRKEQPSSLAGAVAPGFAAWNDFLDLKFRSLDATTVLIRMASMLFLLLNEVPPLKAGEVVSVLLRN